MRLDTGAVEGVEALVRWQHPERGLLPPDAFLAVAEETGQVIPITRWLLRETTRQAAEWAAQGLPLRMSVNVSARHFSAETLVRDVRVALRESGLPPDQLVLELTETSVAEDPTRAEDQLTVLRSFGVRVAIDDFGTGWSSLAQLFALPIGTLKIDRSLLTAAERAVSGETGAVLAAIVGLTRTLGHPLGRRGRRDPRAPARWCAAAGCDLAQGWLLGQPDAGRRDPRLGAARAGRRRRRLRPGGVRGTRWPPGRDRPGADGLAAPRRPHPAGPATAARHAEPARQTAPVSDSPEALPAACPCSIRSPDRTGCPTDDGRVRPALDLLIWDAPNIDMTLSTVIGARPTAASRPRFDAIAAWFVDGAGRPGARRTPPTSRPASSPTSRRVVGSLQRWVEALRGFGFAVFARPKTQPDDDIDQAMLDHIAVRAHSHRLRRLVVFSGDGRNFAEPLEELVRRGHRRSSSSPSARSPATRSAPTCSSSSTSRTSRVRSPCRWTASVSTPCRRTARGCGRPGACATSSAPSRPAATAERYRRVPVS